MSLFAPRLSVEQVEIGPQFDTRCDAAGLLPVVVMDRVTCNVLILGYRKAQALQRIVLTGGAYARLSNPRQAA